MIILSVLSRICLRLCGHSGALFLVVDQVQSSESKSWSHTVRSHKADKPSEFVCWVGNWLASLLAV